MRKFKVAVEEHIDKASIIERKMSTVKEKTHSYPGKIGKVS